VKQFHEMSSCFDTMYVNVTDRQRDRQTDRQREIISATYAHGKVVQRTVLQSRSFIFLSLRPIVRVAVTREALHPKRLQWQT